MMSVCPLCARVGVASVACPRYRPGPGRPYPVTRVTRAELEA